MNHSVFLLFLLSISICFSQQTGTITDVRDGKVYKTVVIGTQTWTVENLNVSTFRNGDPIPEAKTDEEWIKAGNEGNPAWCYYYNDTKNGEIYGKLYNWYAVNDPRGLAPEGWQVPSYEEFSVLIDYLGGDSIAGKKMKAGNYWDDNRNGTNESSFSVIPSGSRSIPGEFGQVGKQCCLWSSTEDEDENVQTIFLFGANYVHRTYNGKPLGGSVRCLKKEIPVYDISNRKQNNENIKKIYKNNEIKCETTGLERVCREKASGELLNGIVEIVDINEYRTLKSQNEYKNGKLDGLSQYWKNDQLIKESNHLNGWHFGEYKEWHDNGQLKIIQKRNEYHCLIDDWFEWYSNGIMKFEAHFFDEQKNSLNTVQSTYGIGNGILKGSYREWHSDGKKAVEGQYDDSGTGLQVGIWNYWHSNGRMAKIIEYQYGVNWKERRFKEDGAEIFPPFKQ